MSILLEPYATPSWNHNFQLSSEFSGGASFRIASALRGRTVHRVETSAREKMPEPPQGEKRVCGRAPLHCPVTSSSTGAPVQRGWGSWILRPAQHFLKWIENESIAQCAYHEPSPAKTAPPLGMVLAEEPEEPLTGAP